MCFVWHGTSLGTALASRNEQYERFYLGSGARNLQNIHTRFDRTRADRLVQRFLDPPLLGRHRVEPGFD